MPNAHLPSLPTFNDSELRGLAMAASKRAQNPDDSQPYRAMWHEISVLCAEEVDRRRQLLTGMERDLAGIPQEVESGAVVDGDFEIPSEWIAE